MMKLVSEKSLKNKESPIEYKCPHRAPNGDFFHKKLVQLRIILNKDFSMTMEYLSILSQVSRYQTSITISIIPIKHHLYKLNLFWIPISLKEDFNICVTAKAKYIPYESNQHNILCYICNIQYVSHISNAMLNSVRSKTD